MGLCSSSNNEEDLPRTGSWASTDSQESYDGHDDYGPSTEEDEVTNLFGMKSDAEGVISMLRSNSASLTRLTDAKNPRGAGHVACQNQCGPNANDTWCTNISNLLSDNRNLTELHFGSGHHVQVGGAEALGKALKTNIALIKLSMVYGTPGIGAEGTKRLAQGGFFIFWNVCYSVLLLNWCLFFGSTCMLTLFCSSCYFFSLFSVLPFNTTLEILDLTSNAIGDEGATGLSIAFLPKQGSEAESLEEEESKVEVVAQDLSALTFDSIDTVWRPNTTLRSLLLSGNSIGPDGAISLSLIVRFFFIAKRG